MAAFSTAILHQYWIGTLWPTICLSDQLNKNIDKIGCIEQVFYYYSIIVITGTFKRCMLLELVMSKSISEEIHTPPPKKKKKELNKIFIPLEFYTFCLLFPIFNFPNIPMLVSYPNHMHVTAIHVNAWSYVSFFHFEIYCTIFTEMRAC